MPTGFDYKAHQRHRASFWAWEFKTIILNCYTASYQCIYAFKTNFLLKTNIIRWWSRHLSWVTPHRQTISRRSFRIQSKTNNEINLFQCLDRQASSISVAVAHAAHFNSFYTFYILYRDWDIHYRMHSLRHCCK